MYVSGIDAGMGRDQTPAKHRDTGYCLQSVSFEL
jgi:hypothetical protein